MDHNEANAIIAQLTRIADALEFQVRVVEEPASRKDLKRQFVDNGEVDVSDNSNDGFGYIVGARIVRIKEGQCKALGMVQVGDNEFNRRRWGVNVWPEVMDTITDNWREWDIQDPGQEGFQDTDGKTVPADIGDLVVSLKDNGDPEKVTGFRP